MPDLRAPSVFVPASDNPTICIEQYDHISDFDGKKATNLCVYVITCMKLYDFGIAITSMSRDGKNGFIDEFML